MLRELPMIDDPRISLGHISTFSTCHLTNSVWALARLNLHSSSLYDAVAMALIPRMRNVADKGLAELAAVYTRRAVRAVTHAKHAMPLAIAKQLEQRIARGRIVPNALSEILWALWTATLVEGAEWHALKAHTRALLSAGEGAMPVPILHDSHALPAVLEDLSKPHGLSIDNLHVTLDEEKLDVSVSSSQAVHDALKKTVLSLGNLPFAVRLPTLSLSLQDPFFSVTYSSSLHTNDLILMLQITLMACIHLCSGHPQDHGFCQQL